MDFQFTPESEHNPEESLSGIVHTPGVTDFSSPHTLGEGAPLKPGIEGGALEGMGGSAKPTLHVGEATDVNSYAYGDVISYKTPSNGFVDYHYSKEGDPKFAAEYPEGNYVKPGISYQPNEINFPPHPLAQPAPTKPVLHTGELEPAMGIGGSLKADTPNGGKIYYNYSGGKPFSANVYNAGGEWTATHYPDSITFPPAPKAEAKSEPAVHDTYSTQFVYYKNFDDDKPEFEFKAQPGLTENQNVISAPLITGGSVLLYYKGFEPSKAFEYNSHGQLIKTYSPEEVNFPQHPLEQVPWEVEKPSVTLPKVSLGPKYEEEPIEELYKPREDSSYPKAQFSAPLSRDEIDSIREYTGSYYSDINHYVRNKSNLDEGDFVRNEKHEDHMANLDSAIAKASLPEPVTLYRGISSTLFSKFASRLEPGETILHQNYMSTSSRHEFAQAWKSGHTMILETPAGTHVLPVEEHSQNSGEKEIIFPRDTRLKLVKKDSKSLYFEVIP